MSDFKETYENSTLKEMAVAFLALRARHAELKAKAAIVWGEVDYLRMTAIVEKMEEQDISNVLIDGAGKVTTRVEASCSTLDKQALMEWLEENDAGDLASKTINSSTLKSFIMHRIKDGETIPNSEIIKFTPYTVATVTKG